MRLIVAAVGHRMPAWVDEAWDTYARRFPPECRLELKAVKAEARTGRSPAQCAAAEAQRLESAAPRGARRVVLDELGQRITTVALAARLQHWLGDGRDVVLFIGGPDGLAAPLKEGADESLRLSDLTLPHAMVRVILAEALYRAWSVTAGHPYHREGEA
jgi:23S rRNA (pseudouridine1915-N3)-methyltransferase